MPIRWSTARVSEAMDMAEEFLSPAIEPLEQVRTVIKEAKNIPNLPQYVDQHLDRIIFEVDRAIGGSQWEPVGRLKAGIMAVRDSIPTKELAAERESAKNGSQQSLI